MAHRTAAIAAAAGLAWVVAAAADTPMPLGVPDTGKLTIYEVNVRQYSKDGTFEAVRKEIPRLRRMGVGILWLMPINPIGVERRKGTLGSYYSVRDFTAINPEFGTEDELHRLINTAHIQGMGVIIDWVANHTAWDNVWTVTHPEWFAKGDDGGFVSPNPDWTDVIKLDYDNAEMRQAMADAMVYWVGAYDVDGFRCDVADDVPDDFWAPTIERLRAIKPMFMLAEADQTRMYGCGFDATYGWALGFAVEHAVTGKATARAVREAIEKDEAELGADGARFRMNFTTNHDWNSWRGTTTELLGDAWEAATVIQFTAPGMPLIYSGQEAGLDTRLEFFERDPIRWRDDPAALVYTRLAGMKRDVPALHHGINGGSIEFLDIGDPDRVVAYRRVKGDSEVIVAVNLSKERAEVPGIPAREGVAYLGVDGTPVSAPASLGPWGWVVMASKPAAPEGGAR